MQEIFLPDPLLKAQGPSCHFELPEELSGLFGLWVGASTLGLGSHEVSGCAGGHSWPACRPPQPLLAAPHFPQPLYTGLEPAELPSLNG